jgi:hypothetical protein
VLGIPAHCADNEESVDGESKADDQPQQVKVARTKQGKEGAK